MKKIFLFVALFVFSSSFAQPVFAVIYDDFNDNIINSAQWQNGSPPPGCNVTYYTEANGVLNIDYTPPSSVAIINSQIQLFGDFDVQVQWKDYQYGGPTGVDYGDTPQAFLAVQSQDLWLAIGPRPCRASGGVYAGLYYESVARYQDLMPWQSSQTYNCINDTSGSFRISRRGSVFTSYYSTSNQGWISLLTFELESAGPFWFQLYSYTGDPTSAFHAAFDDITYEGETSPPPTCTYTYSAWSSCQPDGTQSRTVLQSSTPAGCTGTPVLTQACAYTPPSPSNAVMSYVANLQGVVISGARIEQAEDPNILTTSASNGSFTLSGLPLDTAFSLKITKDGYVPEYSSITTLNPNPLSLPAFALVTTADMSGWNMEPGKSAIVGQVRDNGTPRQPLAGAVVTCISSLHQDACPYPIAYANPGATGSNGKYRITNVDPGDTVTVAASKPGIDFAPRTFVIHADGISFGYINQTSPSDPTLTVYKSGTGSGSVSTSAGTISWTGNSGTANYNSGAIVTLTAEPAPGSIFAAWSGGCDIVSENKCIIMKTGATTVLAIFERGNQAPVFTPIAPIQTIEGRLVQFTVEATDPDGDSIIYYTEPLPTGASFDPATRAFSWTPGYDQAGTFTIRFFAQDNGAPENKIGDTYVIISVSVPPPDVLINQTIDAVYAFQLPKELENSYIANLKKVETFIQGGKLTPAVNQLNAAIKKISTDMGQGKIDEAKGNKLILMITLLMNEINS